MSTLRTWPKPVRLAQAAVSILAMIFTALVAPAPAYAFDSVIIFDVRKTLALDPSEPVFHDYYINAGPEAGLKKGVYVSIVRKMPIHDPIQGKAQATLSVEVAKVQIIHVERNISVARLAAAMGSEDRPILEFEGVMIGDALDLTTVSNDAPKDGKGKRRQPGSTGDQSMPGTSSAAAEGAEASGDTVPAATLTPQTVPERTLKAPAADKPSVPAVPINVENSFPSAPAPVMVLAADGNEIRY